MGSNNSAHGNYLGDNYEKIVPSDYSLSYFWLLGILSRSTNLDAITIWKLTPGILFLIVPFIVYEIGSSLGNAETGLWSCITFFGLGAFNTEWFVNPDRNWGTFGLTIGKPYEVLSILLLLYWSIKFSHWITCKTIDRKSILVTIIIGAILLLTYYPYFVFGIMALLICWFLEKDTSAKVKIVSYGVALASGVILALPCWLPYIISYITTPHDPNYRMLYVALWHFDPTLYTFGLGYFGSLFWLGVYALKDFMLNRTVKLLAMMVLICYGAATLSFITYPIAGISFLPAKWSEVLLILFGVLSGKGLQELKDRILPTQPNRFWMFVLLLLFIPSPFLWNGFTDANLRASANDQQIINKTKTIITSSELATNTETLTVLANPSIAFAIPAFTQWRLYLSPNIHYSNPLAQFQERSQNVRQLNYAVSPDDMEQKVRSMGINVLIMNKDNDSYIIYVHHSAKPTTILTADPWPFPYDAIRIPSNLFSSKYFKKTYEDDEIVVLVDTFRIKSTNLTGHKLFTSPQPGGVVYSHVIHSEQ